MAEQPEEVFTPASPVRDDMFATRRHAGIEERVQGALGERGRQIIAYGPTGVGKTSLIRFLCHKGNIPLPGLSVDQTSRPCFGMPSVKS